MTSEEFKSLMKKAEEIRQGMYNLIGEDILTEVKRLIAEGKCDEKQRIHIEDCGLYEADAEEVQGEMDGFMMEWIFIDSDGLNFGNGYGDWVIEDFEQEDLIRMLEDLRKR